MIRTNSAGALRDDDVVQLSLLPDVPRLAQRTVGAEGGADVDDIVELRQELASPTAPRLTSGGRAFRMMVTFSHFSTGTDHRKRRTRWKPKVLEDSLGNLRTQQLWIGGLERRVKGTAG